ncbi:unnamed protein product [Lepidochelys olivacea]
MGAGFPPRGDATSPRQPGPNPGSSFAAQPVSNLPARPVRSAGTVRVPVLFTWHQPLHDSLRQPECHTPDHTRQPAPAAAPHFT